MSSSDISSFEINNDVRDPDFISSQTVDKKNYTYQYRASIKNNKKKNQQLTIGIRCIIYSYMPLLTLIDQISCLSNKEREVLTNDNELLNQKRCLRINMGPQTCIDYNQLKFCLKVATSFEIYIERMADVEYVVFQMIINKINKLNVKLKKLNKQQKPISQLVLGLNFKINVTLLKQAIKPVEEELFRNLKIKMIQPASSELMPKLFRTLDFVHNMEIDLNNKTIDFYEFPPNTVANIKVLSFKKHSFMFEKLVELYEEIEELRIETEEFQNVKQSLTRQKKLTKCLISCNYPKIEEEKIKELQETTNQQYEISQPVKINELFSINFYDSSQIDLNFEFKACYLELSNILQRFSKLRCKSITIYSDQLKFEHKNLNTSHQKKNKPTPFISQMSDSLAPFLQRVVVYEKEIRQTFALAQLERHHKGFSMMFYEEIDQHDEKQYVNPLNINVGEFQINF